MQIVCVAACQVDVALVVDCSGSIRKANPPGVDNWQYVIDFMVDLVTRINVGADKTHVAAVSFGTQSKRCYCHLVVITLRYRSILSN